MKDVDNLLCSRLKEEISNYISQQIEVSEGVFFSQYKLIKRIMKFKNRNLSGSKITDDLRYDYYFDIISPRVDSEVKNLRFDTKNILIFSQNPTKDFPAVFISNARLKDWMMSKGEDDKLKAAVEEFSGNGNIGFKKVPGGYEFIDSLNTYVTNQKAKTVDETDLIERHVMTASQLKAMTTWDYVDEVIKECGNKTFSATSLSTPVVTTTKHYEIFEYTGEVSEREFNQAKEIEGGDENKFFLAKVIVAGLTHNGKGEKYIMFAEKLKGKMSDWYLYGHRGRYEGRFWRVGMYELLFDHQVRANEIANDIAQGLEWASKVIFKSANTQILQNIRADMDNGDVVITNDLSQVDVRLHGLSDLIADWNRLMIDADRISNSTEVSRGENAPSGTPFSSIALMNENTGKMYVSLRQKLTLPYRRVFREWVLPELVKDLKGEAIFRITGEDSMIEQFREVLVNSWYLANLVRIGPHTEDIAKQIRFQKLEEVKKSDPVLKNVKEAWNGVLPRMFVTITGENSDAADNVQDMVNLLSLEKDPNRINWMLDKIYAIRNIPVPPREIAQPQELQQLQPGDTSQASPQNAQQQQRVGQQAGVKKVTAPVVQ